LSKIDHFCGAIALLPGGPVSSTAPSSLVSHKLSDVRTDGLPAQVSGGCQLQSFWRHRALY